MDDKKDVLNVTFMHAMTTNKGTCPRHTPDIGRLSLVHCKYARRLEAEPEPLHLLFERHWYTLASSQPIALLENV